MAVARKKIALAVLVAVAVSAQAVEDYINLPNANFQNYYKCSGDLETLAPKSVEGIQQAVRRASHVQGKGAGHSWNKLYCPMEADNSSSVIITTENLKGISIDKEKMEVTAGAGVIVRDLLNTLAEEGVTFLKPFWVDSSIAGAIATATHGSSLRQGSLSQQLKRLRIVLANGTLVTASPADGYLFDALRTSVGRLGVVTEVTLNLVEDQIVDRKAKNVDPEEIIPVLRKVQRSAKTCNERLGPDARSDELTECYLRSPIAALDKLQAVWHPPLRKLTTVAIDTGTNTSEGEDKDLLEFFYNDILEESPLDPVDLLPLPTVDLYGGEGLPANPLLSGGARFWSLAFKELLMAAAGVNTERVRLSDAQLAPLETLAAGIQRLSAYDQFEAAVPLSKAADCFEQILQETYGDSEVYKSFRTPPLLRFIRPDDGLISQATGEGVFYVNIEDYVSTTKGGEIGSLNENPGFQRVWNILLSDTCSSKRGHWGKAGLPRSEEFNGPEVFGRKYCDFACAARTLDPSNKFVAGPPSLLTFDGSSSNDFVPDDQCCTSTGFSSECTCAV